MSGLIDKTEKIFILIVEDSFTQAVQLQSILEENGFNGIIAKSAKEALDVLPKTQVDLIISDIVMPEMNGFELCRRIKKDERYEFIPVFMLTVLSNVEDVLTALECGADRFFTKPYNEDIIISSINDAMLNMEFRRSRIVQMGIDIYLAGKKYFISSDRFQLLDLLLSIYENAVIKNKELEKANHDIKLLQQAIDQKDDEIKKLKDRLDEFTNL